MRARTGKVDFVPISYPESSGSLASAWLPGDQPLVKEPDDSGYEIDFVPSSFPGQHQGSVASASLRRVQALGTRLALFILSEIK